MRKRFEALWAIRPEAALTVVRLMARENGAGASIGATAGKAELVASSPWAAAQPSTIGTGNARVAIIPVQGVLTNDGQSNAGSSYRAIAAAAEKAANDPDVKRIVLHVDSPGGEVSGLPEAAARLAAVNRIKPISAIVDGASASAAYWLTSQAGDIAVTPSGEVGSVGVRMMHIDISGMLESEGYKVTKMHSGDFKTEFSPYQPLSAEAQADMQARLDNTHQDFINAIVTGRGPRASAGIRRGRFGEGRMFPAAAAVANGMADRVVPTHEFYQGLTQPPAARTLPTAALRARLNLERIRVRV